MSRLDAEAAKAVLQSTANHLGAREVLMDDEIVKISMVGLA